MASKARMVEVLAEKLSSEITRLDRGLAVVAPLQTVELVALAVVAAAVVVVPCCS